MGAIEIFALVLLVLLANCFVIQWLYTMLIFGRFAAYKPYKGKPLDNNQPVSVIIAARNEYLNLEKHLPKILEQDYPNYEVIVVNDCSWDQTGILLERLQQQYPHLHIVTIHEQEKYPTGKKFALTLGIKAARNELLVFTDADCMPAGRKWLSLMASNFSHQKHLVLGFSPYSRQGGLLNRFIRFETMMTAMSYFSFALFKDAYMGVGRNLAYRRSLFFSVKGFASHNHVISGDDDLFVNETATPDNVSIELRKDSFMISEPKKTWAEWQKQKRRHLSTGQLYKPRHKFWLGLYNISHIFFYLLMLGALIMWPVYAGIHAEDRMLSTGMFGLSLLIIYLVRLLTQYILYYFTAKKLGETALLLLLPVLDFMYFIYLLIYGTLSLFTRPRTWN